MITQIKINKIFPNPFQPQSRLIVPDEIAKKFGQSILQHGLIQNPVVRATPGDGASYQVGDGWLRLAGHKWLVANGHPEFDTMPVDIRELTDQQMADMVIEANTVKQDLTVIDKANFYKECQAKLKMTQEDVAKRYNITQGEVANTIRLLELPADIQAQIISHKITETHALKLVALKDWPGLLQPLVQEIIATGMSTAVLDEKVRQITGKQKKTKPATPPAPPLQSMAPLVNRVVDDVKNTLAQGAVHPAPKKELEREPDEDPGKTEELPLLKDEKTAPAKDPEKPADPKPTIATTPAAPPKWKRKLALEETETGVKLSLMSEKGFIVRTIPGNLETALEQMPAILAEATKQWEEKK
jgi:ParB family chromosome partitioning protein